MKRIIPIIVIIFALFGIGIFVSWWLTYSIGLTILGTLGYVERISKINLSRKWLISLLVIFLLFSGAYNVTNFIKSKHSEAQIENLNKKEGDANRQITDLAGKVANSQQEIKARDARILDLERQTKIIRSIEGSIECVFSANWVEEKHPGRKTPVAWNRAQIYVYVFEKAVNDSGAILFFLENIKNIQLPNGDLSVNLGIKAKPGTGPLGQELEVLKKFGHLLVNVPFIYPEDTLDNKIKLREFRATFLVNGDKKAELIESCNFEIPIPGGNKSPAFQLNKRDLFVEIFK
jgi:hypothetical protein